MISFAVKGGSSSNLIMMKHRMVRPQSGRQISEVGSLVDLQSYHAEKDWELSEPHAAPRSCDPSLAALRQNEHLICITDRIQEYEKYPFVDCEDILNQILQSITKGDSVLVIGEPGIGKRTLSLGLARKFAALREKSASIKSVHHRDVYTLSLGSSFWSRPPGEDVTDIQDNIREVFRLVEAAGPEKIVLCIDDIDIVSFIDDLVKNRASSDSQMSTESPQEEGCSEHIPSAENMLRTLLFSKKVLCLCTCIKAAYNRMIRSDTFYDEKFTKSFRVLYMKEPDAKESLRIVRAHRKRIECEYGVIILDESLRAAVSHANRYITHRVMPDKALELICDGCRVALQMAGEEEARWSQDETNLNGPYHSRRASSASLTEPPVVLCRYVIDSLITKWCGFSEDQLEKSLRTDGLDKRSDRSDVQQI